MAELELLGSAIPRKQGGIGPGESFKPRCLFKKTIPLADLKAFALDGRLYETDCFFQKNTG